MSQKSEGGRSRSDWWHTARCFLSIKQTREFLHLFFEINFFFKKAQKTETLTVITGEAIDVGNTVISNERFYWKGKWVGMGSGHKFFKQVFFSKNVW